MTHLCSVHVVFAPLNFKVCVHLSNEGFVRCDLFRPLHYMNAAWWYLTPTFVVMCGQQLLWLVPLCHRHIRFVNAWSSGRFLLGKSSFNRLISQWSCSSCCLFSNFESLSKSPTNHFRFLIYVLFHPGLVKSWLQQIKERLCKKKKPQRESFLRRTQQLQLVWLRMITARHPSLHLPLLVHINFTIKQHYLTLLISCYAV